MRQSEHQANKADYVRSLVREYLKSGDDRCLYVLNRLAQECFYDDTEYWRLPEHYWAGRLNLHVHVNLAVHDVERNAGDFCARIEWSRLADGVAYATTNDGYVNVAVFACGQVQCAMFVRVVQLLNGPQRMFDVKPVGGHVVRLQRLNNCDGIKRNILKVVPADALLKFGGIRRDRERLKPDGVNPLVLNHDLADQVIKTGPNIGYAIARNQANVAADVFGGCGYDKMTRMFIDIGGDNVVPVAKVSPDVSVERCEVFFGPPEL